MQERQIENIRDIEDRKFKTKEDQEALERYTKQLYELKKESKAIDREFDIEILNEPLVTKGKSNTVFLNYCQKTINNLINHNYAKNNYINSKEIILKDMQSRKNLNFQKVLQEYNEQYLEHMKGYNKFKNQKVISTEADAKIIPFIKLF